MGHEVITVDTKRLLTLETLKKSQTDMYDTVHIRTPKRNT